MLMQKPRRAETSLNAAQPLTDRRREIVRALHRCIREQGYARTSLTDIALKAGMSPSHIRYYFEGKDAILEHYFERACTEIVSEIRAIKFEDPVVWLRDFTDFFIANPRMSRGGLAVMVEIFGVSVHDPKLRRIKIEYDTAIRTILTNFFVRVGVAPGLTPTLAAEIIQALEAGLKYNAVFQEDFSLLHARAVFLAEMARLAGIEAFKLPEL